MDDQAASPACSASSPARSPGWSRSPRPRASSIRRGALIIGIAAGVGLLLRRDRLKNALGYDDSLDAFGVHGVGGIVGAMLTGVFAIAAIGGEASAGLIDGNPARS